MGTWAQKTVLCFQHGRSTQLVFTSICTFLTTLMNIYVLYCRFEVGEVVWGEGWRHLAFPKQPMVTPSMTWSDIYIRGRVYKKWSLSQLPCVFLPRKLHQKPTTFPDPVQFSIETWIPTSNWLKILMPLTGTKNSYFRVRHLEPQDPEFLKPKRYST